MSLESEAIVNNKICNFIIPQFRCSFRKWKKKKTTRPIFIDLFFKFAGLNKQFKKKTYLQKNLGKMKSLKTKF